MSMVFHDSPKVKGEYKPDNFTSPLAFKACNDLSMTKTGERFVHELVKRNGIGDCVAVWNSLVDTYAFKCGNEAQSVFNEIVERDIVSWMAMGWVTRCELELDVLVETSLIDLYAKNNWYGMHGHGEVAISFFDQMVQAGSKPNEVTFTSVSHACSHAGLIEEGLRFLKGAVVDYQGTPHTDYYTCIIDLVVRAGRMKEAYELIKAMPLEPNHAVWGALLLLGACVIHQDVELGVVAAKWLFKLEPDNTYIPLRWGFYVPGGGILEKSKMVSLYNTLIDGLAQHGLGEAPMRAFEELEAADLRSDEITFVCVLCAFVIMEVYLKKARRYFILCFDIDRIKPGVEH
ncbi:hypothetical protein IFM89_024170 [Coptis chinensis]|uniref:Pentatricopeptide repeat-containing protein n=1 Tax=Coptis chinensis TaxID=261450 RepID=A0A835H8A2_9MAGN|nr:hypothetical protein IFM89_024170 [Coptis chinensis]